jgi:hypothetical protein
MKTSHQCSTFNVNDCDLYNVTRIYVNDCDSCSHLKSMIVIRARTFNANDCDLLNVL